MIDKIKYEEYIESLLNIARLTNKANSILINFDIKDDICRNVVSFVQQDGTKDILKDSEFVCDDDFYKLFLEVFIKEYYKNMVVAFSDSIILDSEGKYTYRVVTDDNDMLSINGISYDYANYLVNLNKNSQQEDDNDVMEDESGVATSLATFILVGGIGMAFLVMVLLLS